MRREKQLVLDIAKHSQCVKRKVGAILLYDGVVLKQAHNYGLVDGCYSNCPRLGYPTGEGPGTGLCAHAEDVVLQSFWDECFNHDIDIDNLYDKNRMVLVCTHLPCPKCVNQIAERGVKLVWFVVEEDMEYIKKSRILANKLGIELRRI